MGSGDGTDVRSLSRVTNDAAERAALLQAVGERLLAVREGAIEALIVCETRQTALREVDKTIRALRTYDRELEALHGRRPLGRVSVALPYNNPLYSFVLYCGGPTVAGNQVLCRPSRLTAGPLVKICELLEPELARLDIRLELVMSGADFIDVEFARGGSDVFLFTGSWRNAEALSSTHTRTRLIYCGPGVNPFVVLPDADIPTAVDLALKARLFNSGQDCLAAERFYVHEAVLDSFVNGLVARLDEVRVGDNTDPDVVIGPLISSDAAAHVTDLLTASYAGRQVILSGPIAGALVSPHVVITDRQDPLVLAEKYAPIFVIVPYRSQDDAAELASQGDYRLGATIVGAAHGALATRLPHPHVAVNECLIAHEEDDAHVPFGGSGRSGFVVDGHVRRDGPILFSVETSQPTKSSFDHEGARS